LLKLNIEEPSSKTIVFKLDRKKYREIKGKRIFIKN